MDSFDFRNFVMLWGCYRDDYCQIIDQDATFANKDIRDEAYRAKLKEFMSADLNDKGFDKDEITELLKMEDNGIPSINKGAWTHFCAYSLSLIKEYESYDEMCDIIDHEFDIKVERTVIPTSAGETEEKNETLLQIYNWSKELL